MNERVANRREFLETVGAVGAASILAGSVEAVASPAVADDKKLAIDGGTPVRKTSLALCTVRAAVLRRRREAGTPRRPRVEVSVPLVGRELQGAPVREGLRRAHRRQVCPRRDLGHDGPVHGHGGAGDRARRRGHPARLDLVRRLRRHRPVGRPAGLRRDRRVVRHRSQRHRGAASRRAPRRSSPATSRACPADMDPILEIARKHKLRVLEDCAQCAAGATRESTSARSATSASTASSSARPSPPAKAAP